MHFTHTQNSFKSKFSGVKTWFSTISDKKRRSSQSSDSSHGCHQGIIQHKRSSFSGSINQHGVIDKCFSPFRRRSSTASSVNFNHETERDKVMDYYKFALDEYDYAQDSRGSLYYVGDLIAAKEAMANCEEAYGFLFEQCTLHQQNELKYMIGLRIRKLKFNLNSLPTQDDNCSL